MVDPTTGIHTVIGVTSMGPTTPEQYTQGPVMVFAPVNKVLSWIEEVKKDIQNYP